MVGTGRNWKAERAAGKFLGSTLTFLLTPTSCTCLMQLMCQVSFNALSQ
jgi:hypothetical protein